ncbi:MAG: sigma-54 dependent transcriptional regulator [Proteobacteria bacterium]|nr:sigma-54 dependent transcriptional regulator [Pseudomonadota bacterium]
MDYSNLSVLIVDDEEGIRHGLKNWFKKRFNVFDTGEYEEALKTAGTWHIDVAVLDIRLKGEKTGIDLFRELIRQYPEMIIILVTGYGNIEDAVALMKEGAKDYLLKPVDHERLLGTITKCLEIKNLQEENKSLKNELIKRDFPYGFVAHGDQMKFIRDKADKIKNEPVPICITGESGTGKEVLAKYIHYTSERRDKPFIVINCAAISEPLLLSELFGHEKGAFTGANNVKIGKFELADGGHLFLDEIGDMTQASQAALLRVLESKSFERVGGNKTIHVDVRVLTATNRNLKQKVESGEFREDLYYRINVVNLQLPPLRERKEEIVHLIDHFKSIYNERYRKDVHTFSDDATNLLVSCAWPGNIRQLKNVINEVILLSEDSQVKAEDLEFSSLFGQHKTLPRPDFSKFTSLQEMVEAVSVEYEKKVIEHFLIRENYNQSRAAKALKVDRKTLWRKIQKYNIDIVKET